MKDPIIELRLIPQNEGQDLNYHEYFKGTFNDIQNRAAQVTSVLQRLLPKGTFSIKLENLECTHEWYFIGNKWHDQDFKEIKPSIQSLLN